MMKRFKSTALTLIAYLSIAVAVTSCGSNNDTSSVGPGPGGLPPGAVVPPGGAVLPPGTVPGVGGGIQISFSGINVWQSVNYLTGGSVTGSSRCTTAYCYCGLFSGSSGMIGNMSNYYYPAYTGGILTPACWLFGNNYGKTSMMYTSPTGYVQIGGSGAVVPNGYGAATYSGSSLVEPGATVVMTTSPGQEMNHANVTGVLTLPPAFMQRNFPQGMPTPVGMAFDFMISSPNGQVQQYGQPIGAGVLKGGVLIYTGPNSGAFLSI